MPAATRKAHKVKRKIELEVELTPFIMAQTGISGNQGESLVNIFPNPCIGETYLYTDDLEAAWVCILDMDGNAHLQSPIDPGKTLHINLALTPGTYQLILKDHFNNVLGQAKMLYISESH